jgi:hypothetical protein
LIQQFPRDGIPYQIGRLFSDDPVPPDFLLLLILARPNPLGVNGSKHSLRIERIHPLVFRPPLIDLENGKYHYLNWNALTRKGVHQLGPNLKP